MPRPGVASPHVPDAGAATPEHAQGPGLDLQAGTYVPPAAFLDCSQSPAGQGFTVIGSYTAGQPVGAGNGFWRALSTEPANMYAILDLDFTEAAVEGATAIAMATNPEWNSWDAKFLGLELNGSGANQNFSLRDGDRATNMVQPKPWSGSQRLLVEINAGPNGRRIRGLNDPGQWLPAWDARGTRALISTRFGVNVSWANGALLTTDGNFTIHRGLVYLDYPDALTRLRLIAHFCGGMVP